MAEQTQNSLTKQEKLFKDSCPELFQHQEEFETFVEFWCPVSIVEADVKEVVVDEYESVELLVLRLFNANIKDPNVISQLTGINKSLIDEIIISEITYGHIDRLGNIQPVGRQTLEANKDSDKVLQHALYDVKREIQIEALTGTVIKPRSELEHKYMRYYNEKVVPNILPNKTVVIDQTLAQEIQDNIQSYVDKNYLGDGNTIGAIKNLRTKELMYRQAYFVQIQGFSYPLVAIPYKKFVNRKQIKILEPTSISSSDFNRLNLDRNSISYIDRADHNFELLNYHFNEFSTELQNQLV
ncbi:MAG: hypothetical protein SO069_07765 [Succinivibrio sp.]|nr:hypothetical protein [Succinivibrio sp.]